jgi:ribosomal subunit interface protein
MVFFCLHSRYEHSVNGYDYSLLPPVGPIILPTENHQGDIMNIQVNTDHNIKGSAELNTYIETSLAESFARFKVAITRIEVHLSDENAGKTGSNDKRCLLEARISHHQPIVVSHHADTIHQAIDIASDKLLRALDNMAGKLTDRTGPKDLLVETQTENDEEE